MENKKVSSKSTKVELLEALAEREKEIEELKKLTDDPKKEQEKAEKERVLESAAEAINSNVFSDETKNYLFPFEPDESDEVKVRISS